MLLFKKTINGNLKANDAQVKINSRWIGFKERLAACLQQRSELVSTQTKKYGLLLFALLFGGSSIAIIIHSVTTEEPTVVITKILRPLHSIQDEKSYLQADSSITKREYDRVEQFKTYLIKLKMDSSGKKRFDSITKARPQLIDSINLFEKMYLQQK